MARKRMIDPRIWDSQQVMQLTPFGFKLYIYMISQADDEGRLAVCWQMMTSRVFPFGGLKENQVKELAIGMDKVGLIKLYSVDGKDYIAHPNWTRYQKIDRPSKSTLSPPPEFVERSTNDTGTLVPNRIEVNRIEKNIKEVVPQISYAEGVAMTKTEYSALVGQYSERVIKLAIEKVAAQQIKTGKKYKSPRGAILQWGIRAALEDMKKMPPERKEAPKPKCPECSKTLEREHGYWSCATHGRREDVE